MDPQFIETATRAAVNLSGKPEEYMDPWEGQEFNGTQNVISNVARYVHAQHGLSILKIDCSSHVIVVDVVDAAGGRLHEKCSQQSAETLATAREEDGNCRLWHGKQPTVLLSTTETTWFVRTGNLESFYSYLISYKRS